MRHDLQTLSIAPFANFVPGTFFKPVLPTGGGDSPTCVLVDGAGLIGMNLVLSLGDGGRIFPLLTAQLVRHFQAANAVTLPVTAPVLELHDAVRIERGGDREPGALLIDANGPMLYVNWITPQGFTEQAIINLRTWTCEDDLRRLHDAARVISGWTLRAGPAADDAALFQRA